MLPALREVQIKITSKNDLIPVSMAIMKMRKKITNVVDEDVEKKKPSLRIAMWRP